MVWEEVCSLEVPQQQKDPKKGKHACIPQHPKMDTGDHTERKHQGTRPTTTKQNPSPSTNGKPSKTPKTAGKNKNPDLHLLEVPPTQKKYGRPQTTALQQRRSVPSSLNLPLPNTQTSSPSSALPELCRKHSTQPPATTSQDPAATHQAQQEEVVAVVVVGNVQQGTTGTGAGAGAGAGGEGETVIVRGDSPAEQTCHKGPDQEAEEERESKKSRNRLSVRAATAPASLACMKPETFSSTTSLSSQESDVASCSSSSSSSVQTAHSIRSGELGDSECSIKLSRSKRASKPKVQRRLRKDRRRQVHPKQRQRAVTAESESWFEETPDADHDADNTPLPPDPLQPTPSQTAAAHTMAKVSSDSEDYDTDLETRFPTPMSYSQDITGKTGYLRACEKLHVSPCTAFLRKAQDEALKLKYYGLTAKDTKALSIGFRNNVYLNHIDLSYNMVGTEGVISIAHALRENRHICSLNLSYCFLGNELTGAMAVWTIIECSPNIYELNVSHNCFHSTDYIWFAKILEMRSRLLDLDLSDNNFGPEGISVFAEALEDNDILQGLKMDWNPLTCVGTAAILNAVMNNIQLKNLSMMHTGINDVSAPSAVLVLMRNDILQTLDIRHNHLSKTSLRNIYTALELPRCDILLKV